MNASTLTAATAFAAIAGITYNFAFFRATDISYMSILSLEDHALSAAAWLPTFLVPFLIGMGLNAISPAPQFNPYDTSDLSKNHSRKRNIFFIKNGAKIIFGIAAISITRAFYPEKYVITAIGLLVTLHGMKEIILTKYSALDIKTTFAIEAIRSILVLIFTFGYHQGMAASNGDARVKITTKTSGEIQGVTSRNFKTGSVIISNNFVKFIPHEEIILIESKK
ncbi:MAG: hypothetical protein HYU59_04025 [Magnetospirillum gryphiswaldense]|nr:hypothetical protein [Magnetospirillum gryphiswaldense]